jgi:hypothetical protein
MNKHLFIVLVAVALALTACQGQATGPVKGVLVVFPSQMSIDDVNDFLASLQREVITVEPENVFDFSVCPWEDFKDDLRTRRTILLLADDPSQFPDELEPGDGIYRGENIWAKGQVVVGVQLPIQVDPSVVSRLLEDAYDQHLIGYIYGSFVSTQMSSPARIDSLLALGFSLDVPKSYTTAVWEPDQGFIQYQRRVSDDCLLLLSIRWIDDNEPLSPQESVLWREAMARNHFYDAAADSVDRSSVQVEPFSLRGMQGWKLLGMWRNPEHLNAGAFTSYVLRSGSRRYLLDMEVFHERKEKEPYIREGWIIMNTFMPGEENGQ